MKIHQTQKRYFCSAMLPPFFPEENMCISSEMKWKYRSVLQCGQGNQTHTSAELFSLTLYKTIKFWFHHYQSQTTQTNELLTNITENMSRFSLAISILVNATFHSFPDTETYYPMNSWVTWTGWLHANCTLGTFIQAYHLLNCAHT